MTFETELEKSEHLKELATRANSAETVDELKSIVASLIDIVRGDIEETIDSSLRLARVTQE